MPLLLVALPFVGGSFSATDLLSSWRLSSQFDSCGSLRALIERGGVAGRVALLQLEDICLLPQLGHLYYTARMRFDHVSPIHNKATVYTVRAHGLEASKVSFLGAGKAIHVSDGCCLSLQWCLQRFGCNKSKSFDRALTQLAFVCTMSDDAAAAAPAVPVPPSAARVPGPDQLPQLRAARATLKQQLKESTKAIRKEVRRRSRLMKKAAGLSMSDLAWLLTRRATTAE